ncbi:DNA integrity scanning protein DisA nucleotide-binding domain protein [Desulfurella sp.]|uniref:DNA integrity scanning protein DisA nucleotide-binding domain protein n=1 Tax=Desulfurella sp. TaxID=1962857 RepID=UPI003D0AF031
MMPISEQILNSSLSIVESDKDIHLLVYLSDLKKFNIDDFLKKDIKKIIVFKRAEIEDENHEKIEDLKNIPSITVPNINFTRTNKLKVAIVMALAANILSKDSRLIALTGLNNIDSMIYLEIEKEKELLLFRENIDFGEIIRPEVFEKILRIALELANQGREGKSVGALFVLGDIDNIKPYIKQMIFNPFKGYDPNERNIMLSNLDDTIKEYSVLDGAFLISGDGTLESAGAHIAASADTTDLPKGLGSRHMAAAAITSVSNAMSIVVSESTGDVSVFKNGKLITQIEKAI